MNNLDQVIQGQFPVHVMPRYGTHERLGAIGQRYLVGREGVKFEIRRPWLHAVVALHDKMRVDLPYGDCPADNLELLCGPVPQAFGQRFREQALASMPNETAAWVVWHERTRTFEYIELETIQASPVRVNFRRPELPCGTWLVMDFHSHGQAAAFFSMQDDEDDAGEVKLAGVFGQLDQAVPGFEMRACLMGVFARLDSEGA